MQLEIVPPSECQSDNTAPIVIVRPACIVSGFVLQNLTLIKRADLIAGQHFVCKKPISNEPLYPIRPYIREPYDDYERDARLLY